MGPCKVGGTAGLDCGHGPVPAPPGEQRSPDGQAQVHAKGPGGATDGIVPYPM